jgi:hypothetical protein
MTGYRRLLYWAALPVRDRRWAAPLSALALGLGLFVGIAIGPGAAGTLATSGVKIVELPGFGGRAEPLASGGGDEGSPTGAAANPEPEPAASSSSSFSPGPLESLSTEETTEPPTPEGGGEAPPEKNPTAPEKELETADESVAGIVVHVNRAAGSYVVAETGGNLSAVHAPTAPRPGTEVEAPVRLLANETFAEAGQRLRVGTEKRATVSGVVTFVGEDPLDPVYVISRRGASMLVHVPPDPGGALPEPPELGALATVAVEIEKTEPAPEPTENPLPPFVLRQRHLEVDGAPLTAVEFAGIVATVDPEAHEVLLSADDVRESGRDIALQAPEEFDLTQLEIGSSVLVTATIEADGRLVLSELTSDEHRKGAEDRPLLHLFHNLDTRA